MICIWASCHNKPIDYQSIRWNRVQFIMGLQATPIQIISRYWSAKKTPTQVIHDIWITKKHTTGTIQPSRQMLLPILSEPPPWLWPFLRPPAADTKVKTPRREIRAFVYALFLSQCDRTEQTGGLKRGPFIKLLMQEAGRLFLGFWPACCCCCLCWHDSGRRIKKRKCPKCHHLF